VSNNDVPVVPDREANGIRERQSAGWERLDPERPPDPFLDLGRGNGVAELVDAGHGLTSGWSFVEPISEQWAHDGSSVSAGPLRDGHGV
jgi:hypothetical protein